MNKPIRLLFDSEAHQMVDRANALPEAASFELLTYFGEGQARLKELIVTADAAYIYKDELSAEAIRSAPGLKFIQKHGLNCKNIDVAAATERGIQVATVPLVRNAAVAEHAFALMLACARKILPGHRAVESGVYRELGVTPIRTAQREIRSNWAQISGVGELMGSTIGIVGLGDIGLELAKRCRAFGMEVFYTQRTRHAEDVERAYEANYLDLQPLLRTADYVVLIVPHTAETDRLIGAQQLAMMKPGATLINVARGGVVDEPALVDALSRGVIAMAGLDVYVEEPLPITSPLVNMSNVVMTPAYCLGIIRLSQDRPLVGLAECPSVFRGQTAERRHQCGQALRPAADLSRC